MIFAVTGSDLDSDYLAKLQKLDKQDEEKEKAR